MIRFGTSPALIRSQALIKSALFSANQANNRFSTLDDKGHLVTFMVKLSTFTLKSARRP